MNGIVYPCALKFTRFPIQDKTKTLSSNMSAMHDGTPNIQTFSVQSQKLSWFPAISGRRAILHWINTLGFTFGKSETAKSLKMSRLGFDPFLPVSLLYYYPVTETLGALCWIKTAGHHHRHSRRLWPKHIVLGGISPSRWYPAEPVPLPYPTTPYHSIGRLVPPL